MFPSGEVRCLICMAKGHVSHGCPKAEGRSLLFRSMSAAHVAAAKKGEELSSEGLPLSAADHVAGGNVQRPSRWFSASRHDPDPALRWCCMHVDPTRLATRGITPEEYEEKAIAVLDASKCVIRYDVSTPALCAGHAVAPQWRSVAYNSEEVILEKVEPGGVLGLHMLDAVIHAGMEDGIPPSEKYMVDDPEARRAAAGTGDRSTGDRSTGDRSTGQTSDLAIHGWARWFEFHTYFVSGRGDRPSWAPQ